jgi:hypothetical protein
MIVIMIIHSNTIHLTSQTAAFLNGLVPDNRNKLEGNSCLSLRVIAALLRGILSSFSGNFFTDFWFQQILFKFQASLLDNDLAALLRCSCHSYRAIVNLLNLINVQTS